MDSSLDPVNALKTIPLLAGLPHGELERLAKRVREEKHPAGIELIREGTSGSSVYLIVSGSCEVRRKTNIGPARITLLGPGQFFGELSIVDPSPRTATVTTYEPTTVLLLEGHDFRQALSTNMSMAQHLVRVLAERLRIVTDEFAK